MDQERGDPLIPQAFALVNLGEGDVNNNGSMG